MFSDTNLHLWIYAEHSEFLTLPQPSISNLRHISEALGSCDDVNKAELLYRISSDRCEAGRKGNAWELGGLEHWKQHLQP